jgi:hypothetical protein
VAEAHGDDAAEEVEVLLPVRVEEPLSLALLIMPGKFLKLLSDLEKRRKFLKKFSKPSEQPVSIYLKI